MPYAGAPWYPPGTVLFSRGKSTYELVEDLGPGHHGERVLVALRRTHGDASGRVVTVRRAPSWFGADPGGRTDRRGRQAWLFGSVMVPGCSMAASAARRR